ncbi:MAG: zinc-ribbon domain-containing protein [Candidatus Bathyarchaeota archaeon]|nr:zinc-ribbon domain-containing protein [Candidatus Bathyarchaeota archaeon]
MRAKLSICISILILMNVFSFGQVKAETVELLDNGGFEDGMSPWVSYSYWPQCAMNATITDLQSYEGKYSIYTDTGQMGMNVIGEVIFDPSGAITTAPPKEGALGWCVGGGAYQIVELDQVSDLELSFWIHLIGATEVTMGTDTAMLVWFWKDDTFRVLAYYMTWGSNVPIYKNFPQPVMSLGNITNILIYGTPPGRWTYVERQLEEDFKQAYPNDDLSSFKKLTVQLIGAGVRGGGHPIHVYWDKISLTTERMLQEEPSPVPQPTTPSPTSPTTPPPSPGLPSEDKTTSTPTTRSPTTEKIPEPGIGLSLNSILLVIFILLLIIILVLVLRKSKTSKDVARPGVRASKTPETLSQREFCSHCGEPILDDSKFCMKCGKPKE